MRAQNLTRTLRPALRLAPSLSLSLALVLALALAPAVALTRCALKMRSTSAEEQLSELQGAMSSNILRYQKEILRLRQQGSQRPQ